jgi:hypothetical protein
MVKFSAFLLLLVIPVSASGQNYNFSVPEFNCTVEVNRDRSLTIGYEILFECTSGYSSIDVVDIGFPTDEFLMGSIQAGIGNSSLNEIYYSTYIDKGVEVHLDPNSIDPGDRGHFWLTGVNANMVFLDTEADDYASMEFTPTWFDGSILTGESEFSLTVIFPEGALPDLVRHHGRAFTSSRTDKDGRVVYVWEETRRVDSPYAVGISFPEDLVDGPLTERPEVPVISSETLIVLIIFGVVFLFFALFIFAVFKAVIKAKRRREQYLPPKLGLTGTGIKRGLTAPMAALLLEEKLDRVLVLIIFGLIKKGKLELSGNKLQKIGDTEGLYPYEKDLIQLIPDGTEANYRKVFTDMIKLLEEQMESFSLKESREYYRSVISSAWKMVEAENSAEKAGEILGDRFQWLLADREFDSRVGKLNPDRSAMLPAFMYGYFSKVTPMAGSTAGVDLSQASSAAGSTAGMSLSQACSQVAGALEKTAGNTVAGITRMSAAVTSATNPVPVSTYRSSGSSGGSGCACACACAGCACACAGGGR